MISYSFYLKCSKNSNVNSHILLRLRHVLKSRISSSVCYLEGGKKKNYNGANEFVSFHVNCDCLMRLC